MRGDRISDHLKSCIDYTFQFSKAVSWKITNKKPILLTKNELRLEIKVKK